MAIKKITNSRSKYYGQYRVRVEPVVNGKKVSVPVHYASTKRQAELLQSRLMLEAAKGLDYRDANMTLAKAFSNFVKQQQEYDRWSPMTLKAWLFTAKMIEQYCSNLKIKDCNENTMRKFVHDYINDPKRHAKVTPHGTVSKMLTQLRCFFKTLVGTTIKASQMPIPENRSLQKMFRIDEQVATPEKYILTDQEVQDFIKLIRNDLATCDVKNSVSRLSAWIQLETGMRTQELQALRFNDLNEIKRCFVLHDSFSEAKGKNGDFNHHLKARKPGETRETLTMSTSLIQAIKTFKREQKLFLDNWGIENKEDLVLLCLTDKRLASLSRPITQRSMNSMVQKLTRQIGVKTELHISCYTLRRTAASKIARINPNYPLDAARLGHSLSVFMNTYVKADQSSDGINDGWIQAL